MPYSRAFTPGWDLGLERRSVAKGYLSCLRDPTIFACFLLSLALAWLAVRYYELNGSAEAVWLSLQNRESLYFAMGYAALVWYYWRQKAIYIVDYCVLKPDISKFSAGQESFLATSRRSGFFTEEQIEFQARLLKNAGIGETTCFPAGILSDPPNCDMEMARKEASYVFSETLTELFRENPSIKPQDVDFLIVNCSLFCPTPSLSSIIVNKFQMKETIKSFNLGGMGCSASPIAVDLARELMGNHPNTTAIVVSTENITQNWYRGVEKGMLISNVLFRMGGAAILLTNKPWYRRMARARVVDVTRLHKGAQDDAYSSVYQREDESGFHGVRLSKDLVKIAAKGIQRNLYYTCRKNFSVFHQLQYFGKLVAKKAMQAVGKRVPFGYENPNFERIWDHFCVHCAGKRIIEEIQSKMNLSDTAMEPSFATLYNVANVSSATLWYELDYIERVQSGKCKAGQTVFMLTFGSGFKCQTMILELL